MRGRSEKGRMGMTYWTLAFIFVSCIAVYALWATHQNTESIKKMMEIIEDMGKLEDEMYATLEKESALVEKLLRRETEKN